jgi:RNA polymerase sigma-70 factor (ECF subfamily)
MSSDRPAADRGPQHFATTRWSRVLTAGRQDTASADQALAELCRQYWYPLYAYVRRRGHDADDARDLTQSFFAMLLEKGTVGVADPQRGRFRTFLLASMQNFLAGEWRKQQALKRGGGAEFLSLDFEAAEETFVQEPATGLDPEAAFQRKWALELLERAIGDLERQYADAGKSGLFAALKGTLGGVEPDRPYPDLARELAMSEGALRTAISRLRARWRDRVRALVAETVDDDDLIQDELQGLITALEKDR